MTPGWQMTLWFAQTLENTPQRETPDRRPMQGLKRSEN
jgi:hypothetical protein